MVVSSLSPQYIDFLLTGSQRLITYVVPQPLSRSDIGQKECIRWANDVGKVTGCQVEIKLDTLRNA